MFAFSIWLAMAKKVMKKSAPKVKKDANLASLPFDPPKEEGMSLEAKIELFQKSLSGPEGGTLAEICSCQGLLDAQCKGLARRSCWGPSSRMVGP